MNVFPLVTAWLDDKAPVAKRRELPVSTKAQWVAVDVDVTEPSEIADTTASRPFGDRSLGAATEGVNLFPSV